MTTMVSRNSTPLASSLSIQEKGSRNKRKFCAYSPLLDPNFMSDQMQSDISSLDLSHIEQNLEMLSLGSHVHGSSMCDICSATYHPKEVEQDQFSESEWNEVDECELEDALLRNLSLTFISAIKTIMSHGYNEEISVFAVLRTRLHFDNKDTVRSIVDNALLFLKSGQEFDCLEKGKLLQELNEKELSALNEMISVVRDIRPSFTRGEAMWRLLLSDMNVFHACSFGSSFPSAHQVEQETKSSHSSIQTNSESTNFGSQKQNLVLPNPKNSKGKDVRNVLGIPSLPNGTFSASIKGSSTSLECVIEETSTLYISQSKSSNGRKANPGNSKRDSIHRHKTVHIEKSYHTFGSKTTMRASKQNGLNGLIFDKKSKAFTDPTNALSMKKALMKLNKVVCGDIISPQADMSVNISVKNMPVEITNIENTELSSSPSSDVNNGNLVPHDKMDEIIHKLSQYEKQLDAERQGWSEWAQQKVMEAARRLGKDKSELQVLRQEKDVDARLKMEKQYLEENTRKKLFEMENALSKASALVEIHSAEARDKEKENTELRRALIAAKFQAAESAASCREITKKEMDNTKSARSWERERSHLQEKLAAEKKKPIQLKQQLGEAKERYEQFEARWKNKEKAKLELLDQHNALKIERDQIEVSGRSKENAMKLKAETDFQKHKDNVRKLELQITQLRQKANSSKVAALKKWSNDPKVAALKKWSNDPKIASGTKFVSNVFELNEEYEDVDREKECVMCLSEEMSVLYLPCSHQIVCEGCNAMHEKQGMKDCPSCRTIIEKRILVRMA